MRRFIRISSVACIGLLVLAGTNAAAEPQRFTGQGSGTTADFDFDGPWTLDWSTRSEFPLAAEFELRLRDQSGRVVGTIVQLEGTGSGYSLFEQPGIFSIEVVATNVGWELEVDSVSEEQARQMKQATEGTETLEQSVRKALRRLPAGTFSSWRPVDNSTLLLFSDFGLDWRATFSPPCPGLGSATALSFVSPAYPARDEYDSILLDDGTRCYFNEVTPTIAE